MVDTSSGTSFQQEEKDPLSFFTAGDSGSNSDSESEGDTEEENQDFSKSKDSGKSTAPATKLPSPTTLFATVGRPSFLETKEDNYVDWNSLSKCYEPNTYSAPPVQFSPVTEGRDSEDYAEDAVISSAPVKYGKELSDIQKHLVIHEKRSVTTALNILNDRGESASKKQKTESFRQKEKRKRDQGQSSRGKSYVEEEKRILRQDFSAQ
ncbi:UPF0690 protein C1orf52 homolog [Montipora capricornis]|uniref:UPF0690 protein C1orf52 homolog n=1 Tax=Montipora capricornis TaxID=246305 RepID=UPI0035F1593D